MTRDELRAVFEEFDDEYLEFEKYDGAMIPKTRPDLTAFTLLHQLVPGTEDMISGAAHDQIFLSVDIDALALVITKEQVRTLIRCSVRLDSWSKDLAMFV